MHAAVSCVMIIPDVIVTAKLFREGSRLVKACTIHLYTSPDKASPIT